MLKINDTIYIIYGHSITKTFVYMTNDEEFIAGDCFDPSLSASYCRPYKFTEEGRRWTRTFDEAVDVLGGEVEEICRDYWELKDE